MACFKMFKYSVFLLTFKLSIFSQQMSSLFNILFSGVPGNFQIFLEFFWKILKISRIDIQKV